jgi:putative membrane protein
MISTILSIVIVWLLSALVIYIVGRLNLGMTVESFGAALIAAAAIALVSGLVSWLLGFLGLSIGGGLLGGIISLVVAAVVLLISDRFVSGMKVNGFVGAIVAALAIGVVGWLANWIVGLFGF